MARGGLDLDVDSPEKVAVILDRAADAFFESAGELDSAWQDKSGDVWAKLAMVLQSAASRCRRIAK